MVKSLELTEEQWQEIRAKIVSQYGPSIVVSFIQRRKLGFVCRSKKYWEEGVYIDFWEEKYKTQFILKWL